MTVSFGSETRSISEIFAGKTRYTVPVYQRPYSWTADHASKLLDDISTAFSEMEQRGGRGELYFLGAMVVMNKDSDDPKTGRSDEVTTFDKRVVPMKSRRSILSTASSG